MNAIPRMEARADERPPVTFLLDGREDHGAPGETLIEVADREGIEIPRLCYKEGMEADGNCRSCMVEIKGERVLAPPAAAPRPRACRSPPTTSA
jgi:formate dehydrogenase major subunit